jgi:gamma-glutamyltranspeptidase
MISNMVDFGLNPQAAIDAPRCFTEYGPMKVEKGYSATVHQELADLGHNVVVPPVGIGGAQAIRMLSTACWKADRTRGRTAAPSAIEGADQSPRDQLSWYSSG